MRAVRFGLALLLLLSAAGTSAQTRSDNFVREGRALFETVFNPARNFAGDIRPSSDDELLLTAVASGRDDYVPEYSLAIAYLCVPVNPHACQGHYFARLLRLGHATFPWDQWLAGTRSSALLDRAGMDWLEADVAACEGGIGAMDAIRLADWRPDLHYTLVPMEQREVIMHPAMLRVRMTGTYITSRYQGWRLAEGGVPAAVRQLLTVLEPCWRPSRSAPPWRRRTSRR